MGTMGWDAIMGRGYQMVKKNKNSELENFKNEWEETWNPTIQEDEPGLHTKFIKIFNPFA